MMLQMRRMRLGPTVLFTQTQFRILCNDFGAHTAIFSLMHNRVNLVIKRLRLKKVVQQPLLQSIFGCITTRRKTK